MQLSLFLLSIFMSVVATGILQPTDILNKRTAHASTNGVVLVEGVQEVNNVTSKWGLGMQIFKQQQRDYATAGDGPRGQYNRLISTYADLLDAADATIQQTVIQAQAIHTGTKERRGKFGETDITTDEAGKAQKLRELHQKMIRSILRELVVISWSAHFTTFDLPRAELQVQRQQTADKNFGRLIENVVPINYRNKFRGIHNVTQFYWTHAAAFMTSMKKTKKLRTLEDDELEHKILQLFGFRKNPKDRGWLPKSWQQPPALIDMEQGTV